MVLDPEKLKSWPLPAIRQGYTARDSILYAVGVGASIDHGTGIAYLYEGHGPATLPTMATVIGQRAMWMDAPELGVDWRRIVHGEQKLTVHQPLPAAGEIVSEERITDIYDKGADKGAILWTERTIRSADGAILYSTLHTAYFCRGDGGFGGAPGPDGRGSPIPDREADGVIDLPTRPDQAIIYRLSGDVNPLHIDESFAKKAGFPGPILHGLCSYGMAARAIVAALCDGDSTRLAHIATRFSAPAYPGETIRTEYWRLDDGSAAFRCRAAERDVVILNNGTARFHAPAN